MNNLQLIEKALYYIDEHICEELSYERLAEVFGYSSFHFHMIFSSVTDLSITESYRNGTDLWTDQELLVVPSFPFTRKR